MTMKKWFYLPIVAAFLFFGCDSDNEEVNDNPAGEEQIEQNQNGAESGDAESGDVESGDAEGGNAEGGDAEGGDAEGGDAEGGDADAELPVEKPVES